MTDDTWSAIDDVNYIIVGARNIIDGGQRAIRGTQDITRRTWSVIDGAAIASDRPPSAIDPVSGTIDATRSIIIGQGGMPAALRKGAV